MRLGFSGSRRVRILALVGVECLFAIGYLAAIHSFDRALERMDDVLDDAVPAMHQLALIHGITDAIDYDMRDLALKPSPFLDPGRRGQMSEHVTVLVESIPRHIERYETYPSYPAEPPLQKRLVSAVETLRKAIMATLGSTDPDVAHETYKRSCVPALDAVEAVVSDLIALNAEAAARTGREVAHEQERARHDVLSVLVVSMALAFAIWFAIDRSVSVTERRSREQIEELDAFAGRIAHDLRGPLSPMALAVDMIRVDLGDDASDRARSSLERLRSGVQRMAALIEGLLDFARSGAAADRRAEATAADVVNLLLNTLKPLAEKESVTLSVDVAPDIKLAAAPGVISSIVQNLVRNAIFHMGDTTTRVVTLRITAEPSSPHAVIEVTDTGPGIPEDVRRRLFRAFERGPTRATGYGLGLATVKRLADGHRGGVSVKTEVGIGSTFRVWLPRVA